MKIVFFILENDRHNFINKHNFYAITVDIELFRLQKRSNYIIFVRIIIYYITYFGCK